MQNEIIHINVWHCAFLPQLVRSVTDETNPRRRATTTPNDLDHGDATQLHCEYDCPSFARASPFYLAHARLVSQQNMSLINVIRASITLLFILRYRMYPYYSVLNPFHEPIWMTSSATCSRTSSRHIIEHRVKVVVADGGSDGPERG
jgi:hypothetical protein